MADPQTPVVGDLLGLPAEELQRPQPRGDLLDYYLGPTGIPDRLRAANEILNPIRGISDAMYYSGQAVNPDLPAAERRRMAGQAAMETGIAALPVGLAKVAGRYMRAVPGGQADDAQAVVETMTGATPDLQDPSRRRFMAGMGAAAAAPLLPAEELLATGTRATARGAGSTALGGLLAKRAEKLSQVYDLDNALRPLKETMFEAYRLQNRPPILTTPEASQKFNDAQEAARRAEPDYRELRFSIDDLNMELNDIDDEVVGSLTGADNVQEVLGSLDPKDARKIKNIVLETLSRKASLANVDDFGGVESSFIDDILMSVEAQDVDQLISYGLTEKEAELALDLLSDAGY